MMSRVQLVLAGALLVSAGGAFATPPADRVTLANRTQAVAARMSSLESYDRATRALPLSAGDERDRAIQAALDRGITYRQARIEIAESPEVVNARWNKHDAAMQEGGAHEAGWAASARR